MGLNDEILYIDNLCRDISARRNEEGFAPFMHLGEFDEGASRSAPITAASFERAQRVLTDRTIAHACLPQGAAVLEVGCGFGGNIAVLNETGRASHIIGLDIGRRQLDLARQIIRPRAGVQIDWVLGDATQLPFADATFDAVFAIECAFHFPSRRAFAMEARRVLRSGGRLVLTDLIGSSARTDDNERHSIKAILRADLSPYPDLESAEGDWASIAESAGLLVVLCEDLTAAVAPSFEHILRDKPLDPRAHRDPNDRGAAALSLALSRGFLAMQRWAFVRP